MPDSDGYPTNKELRTIESWDTIHNLRGLLLYIGDVWWAPEFGYELRGKHVLWLDLHTGGWSGNEDIISSLKKNLMFWIMGWQKSTRGGHFYFKFDKIKKRKK